MAVARHAPWHPLVLLCLLVRPSAGVPLVVRPDGSGDYPTIQAAVDAAASGDELLLTDGTFVGPGNRGVLIRTKAVEIRSESGNPASCIIDCERVSYAFNFDRIAGTPRLADLTVTGGGGYDLGGAVTSVSASPLIQNCVFRENQAEEGGAIFCQWGSPVIEDCVIVNNVATVFPGGGLIFGACIARIARCTIARNSAGPNNLGGGVACGMNTELVVENTIIAESLVGEAIYCDVGSSASLECTDLFGNAGGDWVGSIADQLGTSGNASVDPLFCSADSGDFSLRDDSPCLPAGSGACGLIGALGVGCSSTGLRDVSWGSIKALFR